MKMETLDTEVKRVMAQFADGNISEAVAHMTGLPHDGELIRLLGDQIQLVGDGLEKMPKPLSPQTVAAVGFIQGCAFSLAVRNVRARERRRGK